VLASFAGPCPSVLLAALLEENQGSESKNQPRRDTVPVACCVSWDLSCKIQEKAQLRPHGILGGNEHNSTMRKIGQLSGFKEEAK
jgi:hypothetical protein